MVDRIAVRGLRLRGRHGAFQEEREREQELVVDVECGIDVRPAALSDDLADASDYRELERIASEIVGGPAHRLLESIASDIAAACLARPGVHWARVRVEKTDAGGMTGRPSVEVVRPPGAPGQLGFVELHVPDMSRAREYYTALGGSVVRDEPDDGHGAYLVVEIEDNVIAFWGGSASRIGSHSYFSSWPPGTKRGYGVEVVLLVRDVDSMYERATRIGRIVAPLGAHPWGARDFRVEDPFGVYLRVSEMLNVRVRPRHPRPQ